MSIITAIPTDIAIDMAWYNDIDIIASANKGSLAVNILIVTYMPMANHMVIKRDGIIIQ